MQLNKYSKFGIYLAIVFIAFAAGRYYAPQKIQVVTKTVEAVQEKQHEVTTIVEKAGVKTTTITDDTDTDTNVTTGTQTSKTYATKSKLTLSALAGVQDPFGVPKMVYGGMIQKDVLGPIEIGIWGLTNNTYGANVSLSF